MITEKPLSEAYHKQIIIVIGQYKTVRIKVFNSLRCFSLMEQWEGG